MGLITNGIVNLSDVSSGIQSNKGRDDVIVIDKSECTQIITRGMKECFKLEHLQKRLPIVEWLPKYSWEKLVKDVIAGLTVGLTAIPQGIAYAVVAGLQPQYGLYSGFMGCFAYFFLGSCKDITIGPTAIMALMTQEHVQAHGPDFAILLTFLTGIIIFSLGVLRLGFLVEFISMPVTVGFTSAAAVTIASSQIKGLLGLPGEARAFLDSWINLFTNGLELRLWDTVLGVSTIIVLVFGKKMKQVSEKWKGETPTKLVLKKTVWLLGLARNAVVVIIGTALAYTLSVHDIKPFLLTGTVTPGLPPFQPPPFSTEEHGTFLTFLDMVRDMGSALIVVPLIGILESIAIAKAFAKGKSIDATQELLALGISNILGSFVSSFPTTGSFTRTAVNHASGVVSPAGGIVTGVLVLLSLSFLTSTFYYIPKATLAAVIMCAMFYMIEYRAVTVLWRTKKSDLVPFTCTLIACLFLGLEYGMIVGITVNLLFILYNTARPSVTLQWVWDTHVTQVNDTEVLLVTPTQSLVFPASDYFREVIVGTSLTRGVPPKVIIDGTHIQYIDSTMAKGLKMVIDDLNVRNQEVVFWRWKESAMFTLLGFDPGLSKFFRFEESIHQLVQESKKDNGRRQGDYEKVTTVIEEERL
nr:sodium-independent sulfate anion transporter isoform X3 [Halyomorpha halys]